jgi:ABC-2 type transport system permease protein
MKLLRAELRRLLIQPVLRWFLVLLVLGGGAIAVADWYTHEPVPAEFLEQLQVAQEENYQEALGEFHASIDQLIEECRREQADPRDIPDWPPDFDCARMATWEPQREDFSFSSSAFHFRTDAASRLGALALAFALTGFIIGATFVGGEWRSGAMALLLLWRPDRIRVLGAKLAAVVIVVGTAWMLLAPALTAGLWYVASERGVTADVTANDWLSWGLLGVRGLTLALMAVAAGFAIASIGRQTAAALGTALAAVVGGVLVEVMARVADVAYPAAWAWRTYPLAWTHGVVSVENNHTCRHVFSFCQPDVWQIGWTTAGAGLFLVTAVLLAVAVRQAQVRDIT